MPAPLQMNTACICRRLFVTNCEHLVVPVEVAYKAVSELASSACDVWTGSAVPVRIEKLQIFSSIF